MKQLRVMRNTMVRALEVRRLSVGAAAAILLTVPAVALAHAQTPPATLVASPYGSIPANLPVGALADLGFHQTSETINQQQYARLRVALYVPGGVSSSVLDHCPDKSLFDMDLKAVVRGDKHTTIGLQIAEPLVANPVILNPLDFSVHTGGVLGTGFLGKSTCSMDFTLLQYSSPLYVVTIFKGQGFAAKTVYTSATTLSAATQNDLNTFLSAAAAVAGVPTATATPYLNQMRNGLAGASVTNKDGVTYPLTINPGPVQGVITWVVPNAIGKTANNAAQDVILIAQVVPAGDIVEKPASGWTPSDVLNTAFNFANAPAGAAPTLDSYLSGTYSVPLQQYIGADTDNKADGACAILRTQMQTAQLSDHDRILAMWAATKKRVGSAGATDISVDNLKCMEDDWSKLTALGIVRATPVHQQQKPNPVFNPTKREMIAAFATQDAAQNPIDAYATFMQTQDLRQRGMLANFLFIDKPQYSDPDKAVFADAGQILLNNDSWVYALPTGSAAFTQNAGCYAYFPANTLPPAPATDPNDVSYVWTIVKTLNGHEAAVKVVFATAEDGIYKAARLEVKSALSADEKKAINDKRQSSPCAQGWRPDLLFK